MPPSVGAGRLWVSGSGPLGVTPSWPYMLLSLLKSPESLRHLDPRPRRYKMVKT
jgi:hypothetical protein